MRASWFFIPRQAEALSGEYSIEKLDPGLENFSAGASQPQQGVFIHADVG